MFKQIIMLTFLGYSIVASSNLTNKTEPVATVSNTTGFLNQTAIQVNSNGTNNMAHSRNVLMQPSSSHTATASASNSNSMAVILVSLIVVACVITLIIAALFIMRHRFNIWRNVDGVDGKSTMDAENNEAASSSDALTGQVESNVQPVAELVPATVLTESVNECLTSVENKHAAFDQIDAAKQEQVTKQIEEAVACSETPLLTATAETVACADAVPSQVAASPAVVTEQVSSTSLIVNVLNELSESVVCKLAAKDDDPEKQPLNSVETQ